jgi:tetratricopeptide (TPR) repeat protein
VKPFPGRRDVVRCDPALSERPKRVARCALVLMLLTACDPPLHPPSTWQASGAELAAPIEAAARLRWELRGTEGERREQARERAVAAYAAVACDPSASLPVRAEAAFRAAELLRAGGAVEAAAQAFEQCRALEPGGGFGARSLLELGHVHRRAGRAEAALEAYEQLMTDPLATPPLRDQGAWWVARVQAERGEAAAARRAWQRVARSGEDPLLRVQAFDAWIGSLVEAERLEDAAGVLELCRVELRPRAAECSELGARLGAELGAMKGPAALAQAVAERRARRATLPPQRIDARALPRSAAQGFHRALAYPPPFDG